MTIRPTLVGGSPLMFVGEAPGAEEERTGLPFVGRSGQEFNLMLAEAGILRHEVSITNVFLDRPPDNNLSAWAIKRTEARPKASKAKAIKGKTIKPKISKGRRGKPLEDGVGDLFPPEPVPEPAPTTEGAAAPPTSPSLAPLDRPAGAASALVPGPALSLIAVQGGVIDPTRSVPALARLASEISSVRPNVIVAMGNIALQALCGLNHIGVYRGTLQAEKLTGAGRKVIPTYHPAAIMRKYEWRPSAIADILKAKAESTFPETKLFDRQIIVAPTLDDLPRWRNALLGADSITFDIETKAKQITCIGLAPSPLVAFVLPFWTAEGSYWQSVEEELAAWKLVRDVMAAPMPKIAQNGLYDIQYLFRYGIVVANYLHDTMILHHSLYPALPKSLAYLGSIYATERAWKRWRIRKGDTEELKRDS